MLLSRMNHSWVRWFLAFFVTLPLTAFGADSIPLGTKVPSVKALDQDGKEYNLGAGTSGFLLVYFYPKADTPGCTAQACSLRDAYTALTAKGVKVIGVSSDKPESQKAFRDKHKLPFTLLADTDHQVTTAFGVPTVMGFATRQAYLFKNGVLVWKDEHASTAKQADDILAFINGTPAAPTP